jgi:hypothetical protein
MRIQLLSITSLLFGFLQSQPIQLNWVKQMGGTGTSQAFGNALTCDAAGCVYTAGHLYGTVDMDPGVGTSTFVSTGNNYGDLYITKSDPSGNLIWAKHLGNANNEQVYAIQTDAAGNVYTIGNFEGTMDFDPGPGIFNLTQAGTYSIATFICKLDGSGNFVWAKKLADNPGITDLKLDASGNIYSTGRFSSGDFDPGPGTYLMASPSMTDEDIFVCKLDAAGNFVWARQMGGVGPDNGTGIVVDPGGNVYTTGWFTGTADFDPGTGTYNLVSSARDIFVSKLDASGNFVWAKQMGGNGDDGAFPLVRDAQGNIVCLGFFDQSADFDPGPGTFTLNPTGMYDIFICKLDASGNFIWAKQIGGNTIDLVSTACVDQYNNIYATGYFENTVDFDPGSGVSTFTSNGSDDIFITKLDAGGNYLWTQQIGGPGNELGQGIASGSNGHVYVTGYFQGSNVDFEPGPSTFTVNATGTYDAFIYKLGQVCTATVAITTGTSNLAICSGERTFLSASGTGSVQWYATLTSTGSLASGNTYTTSPLTTGTYTYFAEAVSLCASPRSAVVVTVNACTGFGQYAASDMEVFVYPNPGQGEFTIAVEGISENAVVSVYTTLGQLVYHGDLKVSGYKLDLKMLPDGVYLVKISDNNRIIKQQRLIKTGN